MMEGDNMNKNIKKAAVIITAAIMMLLTGIVANAEAWENTEASVDYDSNIVTVSGMLPIKEEADISVIILNPGYSAADIASQGFAKVVNYSNQITSEADGSFSFSYKQSGADGEYKIIMTVKAYNLTDNEESFLATSKQSEILSEINSAKAEKSEKKMEEALAKAMSIMTLGCKDYDEFIASGGNNAEVCKNLAEDAAVQSIDAFKEQIKKSVMLVKLNNASAENVETIIDYYAEYIGIKDSTAYTTYKEKTNDAAKTRIAQMFVQKTFDVNTDVKAFFIETVITQAVNEAASRLSSGDIKTVLTDNAAAIGINLSSLSGLNYPDEVYKTLISSTYNTLEELKKAFNDAVTKQRAAEEKKNSSPGGNGGGGSGSSGSKDSGSLPPTDSNIISNNGKTVFSDMAGYEWAETAVNELYKRNAINGRDNTHFAPADSVTREEFSKMLAYAMKLTTAETAEEFADVKNNEWYYTPVMALAAKNIVNGIGNGLFGVGSNISREDTAVMVYRAVEYFGKDISVSGKASFTDFKKVSEYARNAVSYLESVKIVNGMNDGTFAPKEKINRAQAAVIIYNMLVFCGR